MAGSARKSTPWTVTEVETLLCITLSDNVSHICRSFVHACYDDPPTLKRYFLDGNTTCLKPNQVVPR